MAAPVPLRGPQGHGRLAPLAVQPADAQEVQEGQVGEVPGADGGEQVGAALPDRLLGGHAHTGGQGAEVGIGGRVGGERDGAEIRWRRRDLVRARAGHNVPGGVDDRAAEGVVDGGFGEDEFGSAVDHPGPAGQGCLVQCGHPEVGEVQGDHPLLGTGRHPDEHGAVEQGMGGHGQVEGAVDPLQPRGTRHHHAERSRSRLGALVSDQVGQRRGGQETAHERPQPFQAGKVEGGRVRDPAPGRFVRDHRARRPSAARSLAVSPSGGPGA
jgi:hypothetical protein